MRHHAILVLVAVAALGSARPAAGQSVLVSELCDPRLNYATDRFLEIYNAGAAPVDLTGWSLVAVGNGSDIFTWTLSGTIAPGEALVAGDQTTTVVFPVDFPHEAWSSSNGTWNGKVGDGAKLLGPGATLVDYVVVTGTHFENKDFVRNPDVTAPSTTYDVGEWTATPVDLPTQGSPGTHTANSAPQGPEITSIGTDPWAPLAGETVDVVADVADTAATITSVVLHWGLAADSLTTTIAMAPEAGDTWRTATPIPGQAEGMTVHYQIEATNDLPQTRLSTIESYELPVTVSIPAIQGGVAVSPYAGSAVLTSGVVTAVYGSFFVVQDGAGPWSGLWATASVPPAAGDSVVVRGTVTENHGSGYNGNTVLSGAMVLESVVASAPPLPTIVLSVEATLEDYEGVLVRVEDAACSDANLGAGEWEIEDGSGPGRVGELGWSSTPYLGTHYDVTGPVTFTYGTFKLEPRGAADIAWVSDVFAPRIVAAGAQGAAAVEVAFSEPLDPVTAGNPGAYTIPGVTVLTAQLTPGSEDDVTLSVSGMTEGAHTVTAMGVTDLHGNATAGTSADFEYFEPTIPAGYYDAAEGLAGEALRLALHGIIDGHHINGYDGAWAAFYTTDDKPNGTVWDIYSDVPGGTPPYEYEFGVDQGGKGGTEGSGYNREHSWPRSWFGGNVAPMNSDLFVLYPTDAFVNNTRGSFPYGEAAIAGWTSLNGSKRGLSTYPGYEGTVFEPIDAYKGDLARSYFYMTTRYHTEDATWPGSGMTDGADLLPWALSMLLEWHAEDPVSLKELDRNEAIYAIQFNRNPFIDQPEFVAMIFLAGTGAPVLAAAEIGLHQNAPNPFSPSTVIRYDLPVRSNVELRIFDLAGRRVRTLHSGALPAGRHRVTWNGRDERGRQVAAGVYFYRLDTQSGSRTKRMVRLR